MAAGSRLVTGKLAETTGQSEAAAAVRQYFAESR